MSYVQRMKTVFQCLLCVPVVLCVFFTIPSFRLFTDGEMPFGKWKDVVSRPQCGCHPRSRGTTIFANMHILESSYHLDGMFDPDVYDKTHKSKGSSVALTVFAVGGYLDVYLKDFLNSAELHFMLGLPVTYYVFTDMPERMPDIKLAPQRSIKIIKVERHSRWQDISMMRMKSISDVIESDIRHNFTHVLCFDVDHVFTGRFGSEALGDSVALLHAYYYRFPKAWFTYDRNPKSKAYMETGDFFYHAAVFGGTWKSVKALTEACYQSIMEDKQNNVEALWHDESHLNKYMWLHKPSRVLSPEYCWDTNVGYRREMRVIRMVWAQKHYDTLRTI